MNPSALAPRAVLSTSIFSSSFPFWKLSLIPLCFAMKKHDRLSKSNQWGRFLSLPPSLCVAATCLPLPAYPTTSLQFTQPRRRPQRVSCPPVTTRRGNRSPNILDLLKSPSPIRTSAGQAIFSWATFGQAISFSRFTHFSTL